MGHKRPTPEHLAEKLFAIRENFGISQYRLAKQLEVEPRTRLSEFESGRRVPSLRTLIYYARLARIPLEFIVDDDIDVAYLKEYLTVVKTRGENDPPEQRALLFWRGLE